MNKQFKTVSEYVKTFPKNVQIILEKIRREINMAVPGADEAISYQMPAFKLHGKLLVYFAAFKKHIGLYPPAPKVFLKNAALYRGPKGNLKFPIDKPIPMDLVIRFVKYKAKKLKQI